MSYISPEDLKKLQYVLIEMLKEFDKICRDNNIEYFVFAGTELGAVRHKGIIPWDDDTDVGMMRSEFEKLKKVFAEQDTGNLILGSPDGNYEWHERLYPRIYYKGTVAELKYWRDSFELCDEKNARPIFMDIFLFDYTDNDLNKIEKIAKKTTRLKRNYMYYRFQSKVIKDRGLSAFIFSLIKRMKYTIHSSDPDAGKKQYVKYLKLISHEKSDYIVTYDDPVINDVLTSLIRYDQSFPTIDCMFNGVSVKLRNGYDYALKNIYHDYMQYPPEDKRDTHETYSVQFGDFKFPDNLEF